MFKNVKKALFALLIAFVAAFAFACGKKEEVKEANNENCKEFCETCPTCDKCNNASAETCKEFCPTAPECHEASAETCKKFQDYIAPTSFFVDGDSVEVGRTNKVFIDDELWEPEGCDTTLVFVSADPTIATVDANGVVTGVRPGKVNISVYSPLNPEVADIVEFVVTDSEKNDQNVTDRELDYVLAQLPKFVSETTALPEPWNQLVTVEYAIGATKVEELAVPADLAADQMIKLSVTVKLNEAQSDSSVDVWLVKDSKLNTYVILDSVAALLDNYMAAYVAGEKVAEDIELLANVYGCAIKWTSSNGSALTSAGIYTAQSEDKNVTLDALLQYGDGSRNLSYKVVVKGYSPEEKAEAIMASTFGKMEGQEFNTSIVLPEFDDLFGAKLSYTSKDPTVYDNTGKLVAPVTEKKDVKFTVKIDYTISAKASENFSVEKELTIKAIPANSASTELEAFLATDAYKKYQSVVHAPWGKEAGNIVFPAVPGMVWDVEAVTLDARLEDDYQIFTQTDAGLKLEAQYLRYQLVSVKGTYTKGDDKTNVVLFFNIGISETPLNIITGIWRSSAQLDGSLSPEQGLYDLAGNVSYFDKKVGYVTQTYGSGYFSGYSVSAEQVGSTVLKLAKVPASTADPAWKCAVAEKIEGADYSGVNKLVVTVKGTKDEKVLFKTNDSKEDWVTLTGETQELSFDLAITFDTNKYPMVVFCNPGDEGTGHEIEISKMQFTGTGASIDLLAANWKSLDEGVYNVSKVQDSKIWQTFMMEVMTVYIREDANGVYIDPANVNGGIAGAGGNWGVWYVNTTNKEVKIEVGVYGSTDYHYAEGHETSEMVGSRLNIAMDGYALGFVADQDGKIIHGSNNTKLQDGMSDKRDILGGKSFKAGEYVTPGMYKAINLENKAEKFDLVYTATDNLVFAQSNTGTFKKVVDGENVTYEAIKADETVAEADRYAPTYAKGADLTAEQYANLTEDEKVKCVEQYKAKAAFDYQPVNLFGDSKAGTIVNYLTIPANGYAMSWKYQFYGVGDPSTLYALCQDNTTLKIEHFQVHPLSSMDAEYATNYVKAAEDLLLEPKVDHVAFETNVNAARDRYDKLSGDTLADVFPAARLTALEAQAVAFIDADITELLASEPAPEADRAEFAKGLANMWARLYKTEGDEVVNKLNDNITNALTKKADFDAKYAEYAAIDLHITYDYNGGYLQGFFAYNDKELFLADFFSDLYDFMLEQGAWEGAIAPTKEEFSTTSYWANNYSKLDETPLSKYLYTPKVEKVGEELVTHEDYHDVQENATKFFNSEVGHKYIALMDYVDEAVRITNYAGQDAWSRQGEAYAALEWLPKQPNYTSAMYTDLTKVTVNHTLNNTLGALRFSQWVTGTSINNNWNNYRDYIPHNYWSNTFDRQYTQEHNTQIYHCTDLTVKLQDEPYKEGYKFLGWKFEDGKDAVVTGSMFADVTVYAAWTPALEESIEAALNVQLEGVFYGATTDTRYTKATDTGTIVDQVGSVGLGDYAIITNGKLFVIPKYAGIELGKDATADVTLDTKESVQVHGTDGTTQFSCGLVMTASGVEARNSYGHGALYHNAGEFKVTITEVKNTYGRNLGGAAYGYDRFLFHFDAEKQLYVGTKISAADGTSVTLEPGDFLWCPMTADRFCSGLTNCDGSNGVLGVWNGIENPEAMIVSTKAYLPVESPEWFAVKFYDFDGKVIKAVYPEAGEHIALDSSKLVPELFSRDGKLYLLKGWATAADATTATVEKTADLVPTADVNYYPVYDEAELQDEVTLGQQYDAIGGATLDNLADAIALVKEGGIINLPAGSYAEQLTINKPVTLKGPNAGKAGAAEDRVDEAVLTKLVSITGNNVTLQGLKFTDAATIKIGGNDTTIKDCLIQPTTLQACNGNNRKAAIVDMAVTGRASNYIERVSLIDSKIIITCTSTSYTTNYMSFSYLDTLYMKGNYITNTATSAGSGEGIMVYYMKGNVDILENTFAWPSDGYVTRIGFYESNCPQVTIMDNLFTGVGDIPSVTLGVQKLTAGSNLKIWHNQFRNFNVSTFYCVSCAAGSTIDSQYNFFDAAKPYKFADAGSATVTTNNNCYLCTMHSANVYGGTSGSHPDANTFESLEALEAAYAALE